LTAVAKATTLNSVNNPHKKPVIGILGGIASGKSTVAAEFGKLGCAVIDADKIAHKMLDESAIQQKIISVFGNSILDTDGKINRGKLGELAFSQTEKLTELTKILHPPVLAEIESQVQHLQEDTALKGIVIDMPLLLEVGWNKHCDRLIFVDCDEKTRLERVGKTAFLNKNQLRIRENFQISLDKKTSIAENTIDNNSDLSALVRQVADIFLCILGNG
jgi:dephospho-CoA kinase